MSQADVAAIHADMVINDIIKAYPQTMGVFNQFNIDSCCGGADTLRIGAEKVGADPEAVLAALNAVLQSGA